MSASQKIRLTRILIAAALFTAAEVIFRFVAAPWWAELAAYLAIYAIAAYDVLYKAVRGICGGQVFDENFLMSVATVGAFAVREYPEAAAVMLFYQVGELFQSVAVGKSRKSIAALMDIRPDSATVIRDGVRSVVSPEEVAVGESIEVRAGEKIPLDGIVTDGSGALDTAALTGESAPVYVEKGSAVQSGCINLNGVLTVQTTKAFAESTASKILDLVENASSKKAKAENFITKFARVYTPTVVALAVALAVLPPLFVGGWAEWIHRALMFLVVSCPCALVISVPLAFFGGIGAASRRGVLVKGGNYLELLARADTLVLDKTGTVTVGKFSVTDVLPAAHRNEILYAAATAEAYSNHPIAQSVLSAARDAGWTPPENAGERNEIAGRGVSVILDGTEVLAGNAKLLAEHGIDAPPCEVYGTHVFVARGGVYMGTIIIADSVKEGAAQALAQMRAEHIRTVMLTGDNAETAAQVARQVGIDEFAAGLLPADKVEHMEKLLAEKSKGSVVAFVGDGINDAPVLSRADLGIAMGGVGSDSAIEAADIVLMHDSLPSVSEAKRVAKRTMHIAWQNIVFALLVKVAVLVLSALGITDMWLAIFADVGVTVLAVLNASRMIAFGRKSGKIEKKDKKQTKNS